MATGCVGLMRVFQRARATGVVAAKPTYVQDTTSRGVTVISSVCEPTEAPPRRDKVTLVKYDSGPCRAKTPEARKAVAMVSLETQTCTLREAAPPSMAALRVAVVAIVLVGAPRGTGKPETSVANTGSVGFVKEASRSTTETLVPSRARVLNWIVSAVSVVAVEPKAGDAMLEMVPTEGSRVNTAVVKSKFPAGAYAEMAKDESALRMLAPDRSEAEGLDTTHVKLPAPLAPIPRELAIVIGVKEDAAVLISTSCSGLETADDVHDTMIWLPGFPTVPAPAGNPRDSESEGRGAASRVCTGVVASMLATDGAHTRTTNVVVEVLVAAVAA